MKYRSIGQTGIQISEIGFGAWGIGGNAGGSIAYGNVDRDESISTVHAAMASGVNFFDTADFYGFGESETILGEALAGSRSKVILATKVGMLDASGTQNFSAEHIQTSVENSLRRLKTDYLDLYQLHSPPREELERGQKAVALLEQLKKAGKIRAWGISARNPDDAKYAISELSVDAIQVNFNLVDQRALNSGLFEEAHEKGIAVIVRTPLSFGFLTGQYSADQKFDPNDHRGQWSREQRLRWAEAHQLFSALVSTDESQTPAQFALRFCLSFNAVTSVIPGMLTEAHVLENTRASVLGPLNRDILDRARQIYSNHEFFVRS